MSNALLTLPPSPQGISYGPQFRSSVSQPPYNSPLTPPHTPPQSQAPALRTRASLRQSNTLRLKVPPPPESRIGIFLGKSLQLKTILGTGAYGVVYSAFDYNTLTWYAVKALNKYNPNGEPLDKRQRDFQSREIQLHYAASVHPNIVSMLKIVDDPECTFVILEYCPEGDLFSNITERGTYVSNDGLVRNAFLQILDAVEHCHRLGIYHRDLKPENILVSNSGMNVLLADFGLATTEPESDDHGCGSTFYMSPECLDQSSRKPSYRCAPNDIWSLGVILVNLTCGRNPWKQASEEDSTYRAFKKDRNFLKSILPLSDELNDILGMVFESDPQKRITVGQLKHLICQCPGFSAPVQPQQLPPQSPTSRSVSSNSSSDSYGSSNESMVSSTSSISSDGSDFSACDSPMDIEQDFRGDVPVATNGPNQRHPPQVKQTYVIPSHSDFQQQYYQGPTKQNSLEQPWIYDTSYDQVPPMCQALPAFHSAFHHYQF
ncbi:Negative regulator of sexual conjugation and meiosis [Lachnellula hyalina]|uniref:non-specific serine/threonine protein kinase n=1 Tax=Lachnellula hyalina TaxID=1316788 RepID=A0A8H8QYZ7_9HELO|nr:Negative regulator of sexual conjugation and meiosis [Lachnellula hyalina]TVY25066.1 Negative regulator of sexual conjugation and meiosis [Lachnellula hyalina]